MSGNTHFFHVCVRLSIILLPITSTCMYNIHVLLPQLNYKTDTDKDRLFKFCASVAQEEEFFIRKAIGWALRQYGKTDGDSVREFVEKHRDTLSKLSIREALKHL